jgi:hypothetical protein
VGLVAEGSVKTSPTDTPVSDREREHDDKLAYLCLVLGVVSFALAIPTDAASAVHWVGVVIGSIGFVLSAYTQLISVTTRERWILMPGWICAGLGVGLNIFFAVS